MQHVDSWKSLRSMSEQAFMINGKTVAFQTTYKVPFQRLQRPVVAVKGVKSRFDLWLCWPEARKKHCTSCGMHEKDRQRGLP